LIQPKLQYTVLHESHVGMLILLACDVVQFAAAGKADIVSSFPNPAHPDTLMTLKNGSSQFPKGKRICPSKNQCIMVNFLAWPKSMNRRYGLKQERLHQTTCASNIWLILKGNRRSALIYAKRAAVWKRPLGLYLLLFPAMLGHVVRHEERSKCGKCDGQKSRRWRAGT
jgi:hypothetical protein